MRRRMRASRPQGGGHFLHPHIVFLRAGFLVVRAHLLGFRRCLCPDICRPRLRLADSRNRLSGQFHTPSFRSLHPINRQGSRRIDGIIWLFDQSLYLLYHTARFFARAFANFLLAPWALYGDKSGKSSWGVGGFFQEAPSASSLPCPHGQRGAAASERQYNRKRAL